MDPTSELLKGATCEDLLKHIRAEYSAWWDLRRMELTPGPFEAKRDRSLDEIALALLELRRAESELRERSLKHIEIYRRCFERSGNMELLSKENLDRLQKAELDSASVRLSVARSASDRRARAVAGGDVTLPWDAQYSRAMAHIHDAILTQLNPLRTLSKMAQKGTPTVTTQQQQEAPQISFCDRLKQWVLKSDMKHESIAEHVQVETRTFYRHLSGASKPRAATLKRYEQLFQTLP